VQVAVFGSVFLEMVFGDIDRLPEPGEEIYSGQFAVSCGGTVAVAAAATKVGASAGIVSLLGVDLGSRLAVSYCGREGISVMHCRQLPGQVTGVTVALNFDEDRSFITNLPVGHNRGGQNLDWWTEVIRAERPQWVYLHAEAGLGPMLREARALGCKIAVDTERGAIDHDRQAVLDCAALSDVFLPNQNELLRLARTPDLAEALGCLGSMEGVLVVTQGPQGARVVHGAETFEVIEGMAEVEVIDRTGAGDSFGGAMIGCLALGGNLREAVVAGNQAGSAAVARLGAVGQIDVN
jgi:sugar/nucleoside kinase (ribokinase family)